MQLKWFERKKGNVLVYEKLCVNEDCQHRSQCLYTNKKKP